MKSFALTTVDNPYDPITDFDNWQKFDERVLGYNSLSYLGRITKTSNAFSDEDYDLFVELAIDEIVKYNPTLYKKVVKETD